ncbi:hypothetical protein RGAI101_225 [Roseobacter sp. GAI101]|nr:hypothetical protein RGAI101_225 [Roseobacter sp. GAI101]
MGTADGIGNLYSAKIIRDNTDRTGCSGPIKLLLRHCEIDPHVDQGNTPKSLLRAAMIC